MSDLTALQKQNDIFRQTFKGGTVLITQGINAKSQEDVLGICYKVMRYDQFNKSNDPNQEHDFGSFTFEGEVIFWKIDYYNKSKTKASSNPADPKQTHRVLTIMLASEY